MFLPRFNLLIWKRHFQKLAAKSQKHVLVKISSTEISCSIYNIYNRYLANDVQLMLRERVGVRVGVTINYSLLINNY